ncbi:NUDIX hydrolase [Candidatus Nanohalococcus occultus]|uniref:NUDIX hydrolase n=1 Tax=Candidatus Nanohalococcus occultus TaxID=2978047 RepID=UPI0039E0F6AA
MKERAASAVVFNIATKKFLVVKRADTKDEHPGQWEFPGGYVEENEEPIEAAARELKEETGIVSEPIRTGEKGVYEKLEVNPFLFAVDNEEVELSREHTEFKWIEKNELEKLDTVIGVKQEMEALDIQ